MSKQRLIQEHFKESSQVKERTLQECLPAIVSAVEAVINALESGGKLIIFGNGGSAADSQHIAAELIGRFQKERRSLPAIALTTDTSILTALGNDYAFDIVFSRQIEGLACPQDCVLAISTSGTSKNVIKGVEQAKAMGIKTIALTGHKGGQLASISDISIVVPAHKTTHIQETHMCIYHCMCDLIEQHFVAA